MTPTFFRDTFNFTLAATIASTAAVVGPVQAQAGQPPLQIDQASPVFRVVPNSSQPGDPAYRWQYFSDPLAVYAVLISPSGEYFLSHGQGANSIFIPECPPVERRAKKVRSGRT